MKLLRDSTIPPDVAAVLASAARLDITEFELFRLAWSRWYGYEPQERVVERSFVPYMFAEVVPPWVRHFTREVMRAEPLDPSAFGVRRPAGSPEQIRRGVGHAMAITIAVTGLFAAAEFAARLMPFAGSCMFPPCY